MKVFLTSCSLSLFHWRLTYGGKRVALSPCRSALGFCAETTSCSWRWRQCGVVDNPFYVGCQLAIRIWWNLEVIGVRISLLVATEIDYIGIREQRAQSSKLRNASWMVSSAFSSYWDQWVDGACHLMPWTLKEEEVDSLLPLHEIIQSLYRYHFNC